MARNSTNYSAELAQYLADAMRAEGTHDEKRTHLRYYQQLPVLFFKSRFLARGLLVNHKVGYGKTLTMLAIVDGALDSGREVLAITPKKLRGNLVKEVAKYRELFPDTKLTVDDFAFETLSSSLKDRLKETLKRLKSKNLDNLFIVVDEAHLLFRMIANGSKSAVFFYDRVMASPNVRLLFLSGTPITNGLFQLVPCINMLSEPPAVLPESIEVFDRYFIERVVVSGAGGVEERVERRLKNKHLLMSRMNGLISFAGYPSKKRDPKFPERLPDEDITVEMSKAQTEAYAIMRAIERAEAFRATQAPTNYVKFGKRSSNSSYRSGSRQLSNFTPPVRILNRLEILNRTISRDSKEEFDTKLLAGFTDKELTSPKYKAIDRLCEELPGLIVVYHEFIGLGGVAPHVEYLARVRKWSEWTVHTDAAERMAKNRTFVVLYSDSDTTAILRELHRPDTVVKMVILTRTSGVGLDLKRVRAVIEVSPQFTPADEDQVVGRGIRYESHIDLPLAEQNCRLYRLIAVPHRDAADALVLEEPSTDQHVLAGCQAKRAVQAEAYELMARSAIECPMVRSRDDLNFEGYGPCRLCAPTSQRLFTQTGDVLRDLETDAHSADACVSYSTGETQAQTITVKGKELFYVKDPATAYGFRLYRFSPELNGHVEVPQSSPLIKTVASML